MRPTHQALIVLTVAALSACDAVVAPPASGGAGPLEGSAVQPAPVLALDGEGLRLFEAMGSSQLVDLGTAREVAEAAVSATLGAPSGPASVNEECGLTVVNWAPGLSGLFDEAGLAGWSVREGAAGAPRTAAGLGIGSTRADLDAAYSATVGPSTLGTEFTAGGIAGLLDGTGPDAVVTNLWAGNVCIAR